MAFHHVAEVFDGVQLVVWLIRRRAVDETHHPVQVVLHIALEELLRRDDAVAMEVVVLVAPLPRKLTRRFAQVDDQHAVDIRHHRSLAVAQRLFRGALRMHAAQLGGILAQLGSNE